MPRIDLPSMARASRPRVMRERYRFAVCTKRAAARACRPSRFVDRDVAADHAPFFSRTSLAT